MTLLKRGWLVHPVFLVLQRQHQELFRQHRREEFQLERSDGHGGKASRGEPQPSRAVARKSPGLHRPSQEPDQHPAARGAEVAGHGGVQPTAGVTRRL